MVNSVFLYRWLSRAGEVPAAARGNPQKFLSGPAEQGFAAPFTSGNFPKRHLGNLMHIGCISVMNIY